MFSHESDVSRVNSLLEGAYSRHRAGKTLRRWAARLARDPAFTLGSLARKRLDGLERARATPPGKDGPEPVGAGRVEVRKRRREEGKTPRRKAVLAPFLASPGAVPMPAPPKLRW